jgi:cell division protein FtsB
LLRLFLEDPTLRRRLMWAFFAALVLTGALTNGGFRRYIARRREHQALQKKWQEAQVRLSEKENLLKRSQEDEGFLEGEARRSLGLIRPDEIEFRFVSDKPISERGK